jgi:hypothetical protein
MVSKLGIVVSAACALSACSGHSWGPSGQPTEHFVGHMSATETGNWFVACGAANSQTPIRVSVIDDAVVQFTTAKRAGQFAVGHKSFVRMRGTLSESSQTSEGGPEIVVRLFDQVRPEAPKDCTNNTETLR